MKLVQIAVLTMPVFAAAFGPPNESIEGAPTSPSLELPSLEVSDEVADSLRAIGLDRDELMRITGSTSCQPLVTLIRGVSLDAQWHWRQGTENIVDLEPRLARKLGGHTQVMGTGASYLNLAEGSQRLIIVAREPTAEETALVAENGSAFDVQPVARDAFVFLVNDTNPLDGLTVEQIRKIYGGDLRNWNQVGGPDLKIIAAGRDRGSGSLELMEKHVMADRPTRLDSAYRVVGGMAMLPIEVEHNVGAIGYTVHYYNRYIFSGEPQPKELLPSGSPATTRAESQRDAGSGPATRTVPRASREVLPVGGRKVLAIEETLPTPETIGDGSYPLIEPVYVVIRKDEPTQSKFRALRDWLLSDDGQKLVATTGYVPLAK